MFTCCKRPAAASVEADPYRMVLGHHLYLFILSLIPHTGQVSVVLPAVALSLLPGL